MSGLQVIFLHIIDLFRYLFIASAKVLLFYDIRKKSHFFSKNLHISIFFCTFAENFGGEYISVKITQNPVFISY